MKEDKQFINMLLGELNFSEWAFSWMLMTLGVLLYVLLRIKNRDDKKIKPSFKYWVSNSDNILSVIISCILSYILIRFYSNYQETIIEYLPEKLKVTPYFAMVIIGFGLQRISKYLGKKALKL